MNEPPAPTQFSAAYWENRATKLLGQLEATTEENERLREALVRYGSHLASCSSDPLTLRGERPCTCGFDALLAAALQH